MSNDHSGSMSALPDRRNDPEFGSRYSLPADSHTYRGGSLERGDQRKSQTTRGGPRNASPIQEHSSKRGTTSSSNKSKTAKPNVAESYSSDSSDSDD